MSRAPNTVFIDPNIPRELLRRADVRASNAPQMNVPMSAVTVGTGEPLAPRGLLDSGCSRTSIDHEYVQKHHLTTHPTEIIIPILNADGSLNGHIKEYVELFVTTRDSLGQLHREKRALPVANLAGKHDIFLGYDWLEEHNPSIDWRCRELTFNRCPPRCGMKTETPTIALLAHDDTAVIDYLDSFRPGIEDVEYIRAFQTLATKIDVDAAAAVAVTLPDRYADFADVFEKKEFDKLPPSRAWDHEINLKPGHDRDRKLRGKVYNLSPPQEEAMNAFIDENLKSGRIRVSNSPIAAPFFFVGKKDGQLRPTQDYRRLNDWTIKDAYPLPLISDVVNRMKKARYFSKFDVRWGYNNVRIREGDEWKAAFITSRGLYEPTVMFFGMSNSPATFQRMVDEIFTFLIRRGVLVAYMDDLCAGTETLEEHRVVVREVLAICRKHGLFLKLEKCDFEKRSVKFLGLIIGNGEVRMDPVKVEAIRNWPAPSNLREVRSFMQFCNFYRNFIPNFAHVTKPFNRLTEKGVQFAWGAEQQKAFEDLRGAVCEEVTLILPQAGAPFRLETDASDYAAGGVLHQIIEGKPRLVAFFSKSFNPAERNYEIYDKEMLAVMLALDHWRHFLQGGPVFQIWTDHQNLQYFREPQRLNRRQARWFTELAEYNYTMHHRPGKFNLIADILSRRDKPEGGVKDNDNVVLLTADHFHSLAIGFRAEHRIIIRALGFRDEFEVLEEIRNRRAQRDTRVVKGLVAFPLDFQETNGIVEYQGKVYVPRDRHLRERIVAAHHDTPIAGHPGRHKTLELILRNYWWPGMGAFVDQYVRACDICQRVKPRHGPLAAPLHPNESPSHPWEVISADLIGPLPDSHGYNAVFVGTNRGTKQVILCPTNVTVTSEGIARLFRDYVFKRVGLFRKMISDRGPQFVSTFATDLYKLLGIEANPSTAYHPQTDGQTERENAEVEKYLRAWTGTRMDDWDEWLSMAEFTINNRVSSSTGSSPFFLNHGRHPRMGIEPRRDVRNESAAQFADRMAKSWDDAKAALDLAAKTMKAQYDKHRRPSRSYKVGDLVWLEATNLRVNVPAKKLAERRYGPFKVLAKVGASAYRLELPEGWKLVHPVFNEGLLSPYTPPFAPHQARPPPPEPEIIDDEPEYEVEMILDSRVQGRGVLYLVKWVGYPREENRWVNKAALEHAQDAVRDFVERNPGKPQNIFPVAAPAAPAARKTHAAARSLQSRQSWARDVFPPDFFRVYARPVTNAATTGPLTTGVDLSLPDEITVARLVRRGLRRVRFNDDLASA